MSCGARSPRAPGSIQAGVVPCSWYLLRGSLQVRKGDCFLEAKGNLRKSARLRRPGVRFVLFGGRPTRRRCVERSLDRQRRRDVCKFTFARYRARDTFCRERLSRSHQHMELETGKVFLLGRDKSFETLAEIKLHNYATAHR